MFNNLDRGDIKLCVFMEPSITPASGAPGATEAEITAETNYLCDNYFNRAGYFRIDGKPVIFIYLTRAMTDAELTSLLDTKLAEYDESPVSNLVIWLTKGEVNTVSTAV